MNADIGATRTDEEKKNVTVQIFGNQYPIAGVNDTQYVEELARFVDSKMNDIAKGSTLLSSGKVAILAALNMADELFRLRNANHRLRALVDEGIAKITKKIDTVLEK